MNPEVLGKKYDKIAEWWSEHHKASAYGIAQVSRAISYCKHRQFALDVGCGSGGRIINALLMEGFNVTGIDVSEKMIEIARSKHAEAAFIREDICQWTTEQKYDLIVAWDSIFHLPLLMQNQVVSKLCNMLNDQGILIYTFGNDYGEHESDWHNDKFPYSSIGINQNLQAGMNNDCQCVHLELDQYPDEKHTYVIFQKILSSVT